MTTASAVGQEDIWLFYAISFLTTSSASAALKMRESRNETDRLCSTDIPFVDDFVNRRGDTTLLPQQRCRSFDLLPIWECVERKRQKMCRHGLINFHYNTFRSRDAYPKKDAKSCFIVKLNQSWHLEDWYWRTVFLSTKILQRSIRYFRLDLAQIRINFEVWFSILFVFFSIKLCFCRCFLNTF